MLDSKPLRKCAEECGLHLENIVQVAAPILGATISTRKRAKLEGIIEADETLFPYSEKGSKRMTRQPRKRGVKAKNEDVQRMIGCQF